MLRKENTADITEEVDTNFRLIDYALKGKEKEKNVGKG